MVQNESHAAMMLDKLAGLSVSAELGTLDLVAGAEAWPLIIMLFPLVFFFLNTLTLLMRQRFIVEANDDVRQEQVMIFTDMALM